ncbi:hypothetical protein ACQKP0_08575 [Heyndrickxia sp. NPDC080065]|uniref:hypothetical protein n=1 Tax=Heyndrickxia sp. NPDC080065 TaxID=3390568 RepID=UPI003D038A99
MTYIEILNRSIPVEWLAVIFALFVTAGLYQIATKKKVGHWYWNGFLIYILIWKLSYILFNLKVSLTSPVSILYFHGGARGHILAIIVLSIYLLIVARKNSDLFDNHSTMVFILFFLVYEACLQFFANGWFALLVQFIGLTGIYLFFLSRVKKKKPISLQIYLFLILLEFLIISLFQPLISLDTITFTWLTVFFIIISNKKEVMS